jgi:hypothetical protein
LLDCQFLQFYSLISSKSLDSIYKVPVPHGMLLYISCRCLSKFYRHEFFFQLSKKLFSLLHIRILELSIMRNVRHCFMCAIPLLFM